MGVHGETGAEVLVVDDHPGDRRFIREALENASLSVTVRTVTTRDDALDLLHQRGEYDGTTAPDLILLDWNLSRETGAAVISAATSQEPSISVVVLTGAKSETDDLKSAISDADAYVEKPTDPGGYVEIVRSALSDQ